MGKFKTAGSAVRSVLLGTITRRVATAVVAVAAASSGTLVVTNQPSPSPIQGIDFAWSAPSAQTMRANGWKFGGSYLSYDSGKNWTRSRVEEFHRLGIATVAFWETTATRATQGCAAGASDAREAARQLTALGAPATTPFDMAIDFDATGPDVAPYFRCAQQAEPGRVNAYGGYWPLRYLCAHGLVGHTNFQTYAWSGGNWLPLSCAPLEQYQNGNSYDHDRAIAVYYGQWPFAFKPVVVGPPPVAHLGWYPLNVFHDGRSERKTVQLYHGALEHPVKYRQWIRHLRGDLEWFAERLDGRALQRGEGKCGGVHPGSCPRVWDRRFHQIYRAQRLHAAARGAKL